MSTLKRIPTTLHSRLLHPLLLIGVALLLSACESGIKFSDRPDLNRSLTDSMLGVSIFTDTEILKRHLEEIPGYIVASDGQGGLKALVPLQPRSPKPPVIAIKDPTAFYHSVVDKSAGAQGSYLSLISADLSGEQTAEVTIQETSEAFIPNDQIPWSQIALWAAEHPSQAQMKRYFVQGALLSTVTQTIFHEVKSNATVDGGAAFGAKGKVYATDKATQATSRAYIGVHLLDIDAIAANPPAVGLSATEASSYKAPKALVFKKLEL